MNELYWMVVIVNRQSLPKFEEFFRRYGADVHFVTVGRGTAASEILDFFGLEANEKGVLFTVVTRKVWRALRYGLRNRMRIDVPGTGVAFIIPMSSIAGRGPLLFLTQNQSYQSEEESVLKNTQYELLVVVSNLGYSDMVMDAAHQKGAGGGTIIHAKGTGMQKAQQFLGVSLASEKELILIVVKSADKNPIMQAIMENAGPRTKAGSIVFSLPVTATAGMRLLEAEEEKLAGNP